MLANSYDKEALLQAENKAGQLEICHWTHGQPMVKGEEVVRKYLEQTGQHEMAKLLTKNY